MSWLGVWLWLPPLARAAGLVVFAILALAAIIPFVSLRLPAAADALRRLDRGSGVRHRPATTIADELAVTPQDPYSLALWQAHVERTLAAARAFKAGWPSPRLSMRDPYALRGLILIAVIATCLVSWLVLLASGALARRTLDRRRLSAWDAEWRTNGPLWSGYPR